MNKLLFLLSSLILLSFNLSAQDNYYFPTEEGTVLTYKSYNAKGKVDKTSWYTFTIEKVEKRDNATHIFFTVDFEGKEAYVKSAPPEMVNNFDNWEVIIEKDVMKIEFFNAIVSKMSAIISSESSGVVTSTTGSSMKGFPLNAEVGTTIPDTEFKIIMSIPSTSGMDMTQTTTTYDSKVVAKEEIITPSGTFSCIKIYEKSKFAIGAGDMIMQKTERASNTWLAKNIGFVRTETLDKKGKLVSYVLLEKIEKK